MDFAEIPIGNLPLYSPDYDSNFPPEARTLKASIAAVDALLFVTPEYNRSIPGALKNAIDWASRPRAENSFNHIPAAVIGASTGQIGTAMGQQSLRGVLSFLQRPADDLTRGVRSGTSLRCSSTAARSRTTTRGSSSRAYMAEFYTYSTMVLTVLPRD